MMVLIHIFHMRNRWLSSHVRLTYFYGKLRYIKLVRAGVKSTFHKSFY